MQENIEWTCFIFVASFIIAQGEYDTSDCYVPPFECTAIPRDELLWANQEWQIVGSYHDMVYAHDRAMEIINKLRGGGRSYSAGPLQPNVTTWKDWMELSRMGSLMNSEPEDGSKTGLEINVESHIWLVIATQDDFVHFIKSAIDNLPDPLILLVCRSCDHFKGESENLDVRISGRRLGSDEKLTDPEGSYSREAPFRGLSNEAKSSDEVSLKGGDLSDDLRESELGQRKRQPVRPNIIPDFMPYVVPGEGGDISDESILGEETGGLDQGFESGLNSPLSLFKRLSSDRDESTNDRLWEADNEEFRAAIGKDHHSLDVDLMPEVEDSASEELDLPGFEDTNPGGGGGNQSAHLNEDSLNSSESLSVEGMEPRPMSRLEDESLLQTLMRYRKTANPDESVPWAGKEDVSLPNDGSIEEGPRSIEGDDSAVSGWKAQLPLLGVDPFDAVIATFIEKLQVDEKKQKEIFEATMDQHDSKRWHDERKYRLTASAFGIVYNWTDTTQKLVYRLLYSVPQNSTGKQMALSWGKDHEHEAADEYGRVYKRQVERSGLIVDLERGYLAASPDGLIGNDTLVEVKCPFFLRFEDPREIAKKAGLYCTTYDSAKDELRLNRNHYYYYQIQGQLAIARRKKGVFILWTPQGFVTDTVDYDPELWQQMVIKLEAFYKTHMVPEYLYNYHRHEESKDEATSE